MGIADVIIIVIVGLLFGLAIVKTVKNKGGCNCSKGGGSSCTGSCGSCDGKCNYNKK